MSNKHKKIKFNTVDRPSSKSEPLVKKDLEAKPNEISFLQPEILPIELMKKLLRMRGASEEFLSEGHNDMRSFIIKLFAKHITPKPQRDYKKNRIGISLMKARCRREKDTKKLDDLERILLFKSCKTSPIRCSSSSSSIVKPSEDISSCDRLKHQPISCINLERKKIKLSSSNLSPVKLNSLKRKTDEENLDKKQKLEESLPVINLKSSMISNPGKRKSESLTSKEKKRKEISWP